jgi:hypothetical protein
VGAGGEPDAERHDDSDLGDDAPLDRRKLLAIFVARSLLFLAGVGLAIGVGSSDGFAWGLLLVALTFAITRRNILTAIGLLVYLWVELDRPGVLIAFSVALMAYPIAVTALSDVFNLLGWMYRRERLGEAPKFEPYEPDYGEPWRPKLVNGVALLIGVPLVCLGCLNAFRAIPEKFSDREDLQEAQRALEEHDLDRAMVLLSPLSQKYPNSQRVQLSIACPLWTAGYKDEASIYYRQALQAGFPFFEKSSGTGCFAFNPAREGFRLAQVGVQLTPYLVDETSDEQMALVDRFEDLKDDASSYTRADVILACLNDLNDFRVLAGSNLHSGYLYLEDGVSSSAVFAPRVCRKSLRSYRLSQQGDQVTLMPPDAEERLFVPYASEVPNDGEGPNSRDREQGDA